MNDNIDIKVPYVGMPTSHCIGSNSYTGKIVSMNKGSKYVMFLRDSHHDKMVKKYTKRKSEHYIQAGYDYGHLALRIAKDYLDPHF